MFKNLTSKRITSAEFTIVGGPGGPLQEHQEKENRPSFYMKSKSVAKTAEKAKVVVADPTSPVVMQEAFDKLLVRVLDQSFLNPVQT